MKNPIHTALLPISVLAVILISALALSPGSRAAASAVSQEGMGSAAAQAPVATEEPPGPLTETMRRQLEDRLPPENLAPMAATPCVGGMAGIYPCENVDLLAFMPLTTIGGTAGVEGNDIWGWTDPLDGKEYALMGLTNGTSFVDVTDPENPVYLGRLPTQTSNSIWRDIKVYANHAFIVADNAGSHGMQVFDLTELRNVLNPPVTFSNTAHYNGFGSAHNIAINEDTGYAYAVGIQSGTNHCSGGLHMINIQNPLVPTFAGCFSADGYTHDAQCVVYNGPDTDYQGDEICFNSNEDTLTIVDVSDKTSPVLIKKIGYTGSFYTHQGWLTDDQAYFLLDDELDEFNDGHNTRTRVFDVSDLDNPTLIGFYDGPTAAIDHNLYVKGDLAFEANYRAGLRVLDITGVASANLSQVGYFDVYPANNFPEFNGSWSVYPYFDSGTIIVSGIEQGLFLLEMAGGGGGVVLSPETQTLIGSPGDAVTHTFTLTNTQGTSDSFSLAVSGNLWPAGSPANTGSLDPGEAAAIDVVVSIPHAPAFGGVTIGSDTFQLTATSDGDGGISDAASGTTLANVTPGVALSPPQSGVGAPGASVGYTYTITNTGDYTDTFTLEESGVWEAALSQADSGPLGPGGSASFTLTVTVPVTFTWTLTDTTMVTATSLLDPGTSTYTTATTLWDGSLIFLPVAVRQEP